MGRVPYFLTLAEVVDATTPRDFVLATSEYDEVHIITRVVVTDLTSNYTSLALMLGNPGGEREFYFVASPGAAERVVYDSARIVVSQGSRLIARLVGLSNGDRVIIAVMGVLVAAGEVTETIIVIGGN